MGITRHLRAALVAVSAIVAAADASAGAGDRDVWVNGLRMSADQILLLEQAFGFCVADGAYRYDPESGALRAIARSEVAGRAPQYARVGDRAGEQGDEQAAAYR